MEHVVIPLECLAVAYFIRYKSVTLKQNCVSNLNLVNSSISGTSLSVLATELKRDVDYCTSCGIVLRIKENIFGYKALHLVKQMLKGQSNILGVFLNECFSSVELDKKIVLKHLIEGLSSNSSCEAISLGEKNLNQSHIYYLVLLIMSCPQLRDLDLSASRQLVMPLLSKAFSLSFLQNLKLVYCNISDETLFCLGKGISRNPFLFFLNICGNPEIMQDGFMNFVTLFINKISNLLVLITDPHIYTGVYKFGSKVIKKINAIRRNKKNLEFVVESPLCDDNVSISGASGLKYLYSLNSRSRKQS